MQKLNETLPDFESCKNMIYKLALNQWKIMKSLRPDIQFDDVYAEGQLIYATCLKTYTGSKGCKFTTYLYQNLKGRLVDFYKCTLKEISHYEDLRLDGQMSGDKEVSYEASIESTNYDIDDNELLSTAKEELSYEGFQVFKYIISREWENAHAKVKPATLSICKKFGYAPEIVDSIMGEIKVFWNRIGYAVA
ncbi:MAG: sigma-70 family RNA polymerase sigma factor [Eubacterium sp.]|nr:sigma-70 family RNA polymerase sigma factor [Eubacterium sp.]